MCGNYRHLGPGRRGQAVRFCRPRGRGSRRSRRSNVKLADILCGPPPRLEFGALFQPRALSLQSCAFWRTQPASSPPSSANFKDFLGFCPWKLQPGSSWVGFSSFWLDFGLSSAQVSLVQFDSAQFSSGQFSSIQFSSAQLSSVQLSPV